MSRAYRIRVRESLRRVVRAGDGVSTQLQILPILPVEEFAELLARQLRSRGFQRQGDTASRRAGQTTVTVDLKTGTVHVRAEVSEVVDLQAKDERRIYDDGDPSRRKVEASMRKRLRENLEKDADRLEASLQQRVTDQLEKQLADLWRELDQATNRATAEALKQKAAQIGQIKQISDDPEQGSLTIVLEV